MKAYSSLSAEERFIELELLRDQLEQARAKGLKLDMSRGKPAANQLDLSSELLGNLSAEDCHGSDGTDYRNYGVLTGIPECRELFAELLGVDKKNIIIFAQSSLAIMYECVIKAMVFGLPGAAEPWGRQEGIKFLCPVPGYDRHFAISTGFGFETVNIPMAENGPDMDEVRRHAESDPAVKGIWCVPKYSNPQGYTYSAETVQAFAALKPAADDFRIFWDNAYIIHGLSEEDDELVNIFDACREYGSEDLVFEFASTSKITFPGAGVAALAASDRNIAWMQKRMSIQTISHDKLNQLRHVRFFGDVDGMKRHMKKHAAILKPKFDCVEDTLSSQLAGLEIGEWTKPRGGYFVSFRGLPGTAKRTVELCAEVGVTLTGAGAPFPHGIDPEDSTIRISPSYPTLEQLRESMEIFCLCERIAALEALER